MDAFTPARSSQSNAATTLLDSLQAAKRHGVVCMTGMVGDKWDFEHFTPMEAIPTSV